MPRTSSSKTRAQTEPREPLPPVRAMMALTRLDRRDHVAVLGQGGLDTALALWRAGFLHVDVASERLNRPAFGTADAVIVRDPAFRALQAARGVLRVGGWIIVRARRAAAESMEGVRARLVEAGFAPGPGMVDAEGAWIAARRRPELTLHVNAARGTA